jgi:hypothetical protein
VSLYVLESLVERTYLLYSARIATLGVLAEMCSWLVTSDMPIHVILIYILHSFQIQCIEFVSVVSFRSLAAKHLLRTVPLFPSRDDATLIIQDLGSFGIIVVPSCRRLQEAAGPGDPPESCQKNLPREPAGSRRGDRP